jgi:hypothetical protein
MNQEAYKKFMQTRGEGGNMTAKYNELTETLRKQYREAATPEQALATAKEIAKISQAYDKAKEADKATIDAAKAQLKPGSIYVHDVKVTESLNSILSSLQGNFQDATSAKPLVYRENGVNALIPGKKTGDEAVKLYEAEAKEGQRSLGGIQASSEETASNSRKTVILLNSLVKLIGKRRRGGGGGGSGIIDAGQSDDTPFFDEILNTEWPNSRQGRSVGLEFDLTDFS